MSNIIQDAEAVVGKVESVVGKIAHGVVVLWDEAEAEINADYNAVKSALPASAQTTLANDVTAVKQGASDMLGKLAGGIEGWEPGLASSVEAALDTALVAATNGLALPLVPAINGSIGGMAKFGADVASAWLLKKQAALAVNPGKAAA